MAALSRCEGAFPGAPNAAKGAFAARPTLLPSKQGELSMRSTLFSSASLLVLLAAACSSNGSGSADGGSGTSPFGLRDPGFANTPAAWLTGGGATIEAWVPPGVDPGVARFDPAKVRTAWVAQRFAMPAFSSTTSYALETIGLGGVERDSAHARVDNMTIGYIDLIAVRWKSRICLGERAFGHDIDLVYRALETTDSSSTTVDLDHVSILEAPECPRAGIVGNGDFSATTGWTHEFAPVQVVPEGTGGSPAAHLGGAYGELRHTPVSFPWKTIERPALRFVYKGSGGLVVDTSALSSSHNYPGATLGAAMAPTTALTPAFLCLPEWSKGVVQPIRFFLVPPPLGSTTAGDYVIDDVRIDTEATCPAVANVFDGDFESAPTALSWRFGGDSTAGSAVVSSADAHGGAAYAALRADAQCKVGTLTQAITVPVSEAGRGPALKFWYRSGAPEHSRAWVRTATETTTELPPAAAWTQRTICLNPYESLRPADLLFQIQGEFGSRGCPGTPFAEETLAIDDVEVTTDPTCPTN